MSQSDSARQTLGPRLQRPWDARLARKLITPDPRMHFAWRVISNMRDAFGYFGFRQVFRRRGTGTQSP